MRPVIATPDPDPDGPVSVGSLLRREGRRAAHALDRPLVPRARDLLDPDGRATTHGAAVAAGALLAVTAVLGSNAVGDPAILSGIGIDDAADSGPAAPSAVPAPAQPPSPVAGVSVGQACRWQAVAALQAAGDPVQAVLSDGLPGPGGAVSGAGIVAAALGGPPGPAGTTAAAAESDDDADPDPDTRDRADSGDADDESDANPTAATGGRPSSRTGGESDRDPDGSRLRP